MPLTRKFKETVVERVRKDRAFANALLDEAATLFLNGEPQTGGVAPLDRCPGIALRAAPGRSPRQAATQMIQLDQTPL